MTGTSASLQQSQRVRSGLALPPGPLIGFVLAVVALIIVTFFRHTSLVSSEESAQLVAHTMEVIRETQGLASAIKDAETGQRGFLLTGDESYLEPYNDATRSLESSLIRARTLTADNLQQQQRLAALDDAIGQKLQELAQTIALRREGRSSEALALVRTDRGKAAMDRIRTLTDEIQNSEQALLNARRLQWDEAARSTSLIMWGGSALLLLLIGASALMTSRDYRARQTQAWLRSGQMSFSQRIQGEQRLDKLGDNILEFLAEYLGAQVGAVYVMDGSGMCRRVAGYALPPGHRDEAVKLGEGLLGQAAKEDRPVHLREVPEGYLPVNSTLGRGNSRELLIAPATADGAVQAVVELGFLREVEQEDTELLARVSESLGVAVRASKDRTRLEELLAETQRQSEELQTQQEELRVTNEELEVQSRALKESQVQLEAQQAELEQTNSQLEEQTQLLEHQKDELSQAQATLTERASELERANQYKSEFLANMSHELRTPLNSALILAKILADNKPGNLTDEQVKFANTISSAGKDLLALINDILDLSKIEAGKVDVTPEPVTIARTVDTLAKAFEPLAQEKHLAFEVTIAPDAPELVETDSQRLGQILKNLLSNAVKFTEAGSVSLQVSPLPSERVAFTVRDTGIGIPAHQQGIIFEAFRQADGSTHRRFGGTGLGLSISRDLARLLGGDITVQSAPGHGSSFTLDLPLTYTGPAAPVGTPAASSPASSAKDTGTHRRIVAEARANPSPELGPSEIEDDRAHLAPASRVILIVEDDPRFATILRDLAHEMGFLCIVTHTAADALAAASIHRPNAIVLDINLPDHSGLGVLDQLKRNPHTRHIPVHIASVADFTREALELGAIGYALKPVKREQLVDAFRRLEAKFSQGMRRVLVVEDDDRQRESIRQLLLNGDVEIKGVETAHEALAQLQQGTFDCMVMDLNLPDLSGYELLERMAGQEDVSFPPVIVYTGRSLTRDEEQRLRRFSRSIIIKDARSPERLLDEVTLFLHQVESKLPAERQRMLRAARSREAALDGRRILVVEDDVRNIFALSSLLEPAGARIEIARNGKEALDALARSQQGDASSIDLVLMDIMMPEMDGLTATREIRKRPEWKKLPIIALTAKAMKDDQEKCLAAGANDYIAKPLDVEKLLSLVRVWMPR